MQQVLASMEGVDARVQTANNLSVLEEDEPMVRAAIQFADAIAKGDDLELEGMLSADARTILDDLRFGGQWYDAVENIEQVRIVYMTADAPGEGIEVASAASLGAMGAMSAAGSFDAGSMDALAQGMGQQMMDAMPPGVMEGFAEMMGAMQAYGGDQSRLDAEFTGAITAVLEDDPQLATDLGRAMGLEGEIDPATVLQQLEAMDGGQNQDMDEQTLAVMNRLFEAIQASDEAPDPIKQMASGAQKMFTAMQETGGAGAASAPRSTFASGDDTPGALAIAIQTPGEAYVLGWSIIPAGGSYVFGGAPTSAPTVARASELDGQIGPNNFTIDFSALGRSDAIDRSTLPVAMDEPEPEGEEEEEPKDTVRRTPRGPITIPGGG